MISKYEIFCEVIEAKSFTKAAEKIGYTQGSVSQTIKALEAETGVTLIDRRRGDIRLTTDGEAFYPLIKEIRNAEHNLQRKIDSVRNMENSEIRMGICTSITRVMLPELIRGFKEIHPNVTFNVRQGEYSEIRELILKGDVDFGFLIDEQCYDLEYYELFEDRMVAVLPLAHKLAEKKMISLKELATEPLILIDEKYGENLLLKSFEKMNITPKVEYTGYDEYSICAMVKQRLGVSAVYEMNLIGFEDGVEIREIEEGVYRTMCMGWKNWDTVPYAARELIKYIKKKVNTMDKNR